MRSARPAVRQFGPRVGSLPALPALLALLALLPVLACGESTTELVPDAKGADDGKSGRDSKGKGSDSGEADAAAADGPDASRPGERTPVMCGGSPCQCDNGLDDDDDGDIDGLDAECTGPFDDDESSFATGIPGGNQDFCEDCFWDDNSGSDDDGCQYHSDCLLGLTPESNASSGCFDCDVSDECVSTCRERTPSGCDCFGCCEVLLKGGETTTVRLVESCSLKNTGDPERCPPCVLHDTCVNDCGECELCPGKKAKDLPDSCAQAEGSPPENRCEEGEQVCAADAPCPPDLWCQLGCCEFIPQ